MESKFQNSLRKTINIKDHLAEIIEALKAIDSSKGLMIVIDEVSDFLQAKQGF